MIMDKFQKGTVTVSYIRKVDINAAIMKIILPRHKFKYFL